jgi:hypothetical protein
MEVLGFMVMIIVVIGMIIGESITKIIEIVDNNLVVINYATIA